MENLINKDRKIDRKIDIKKLQPIEGTDIAKLYLRLKNMNDKFRSPNPHLEIMQFNLKSIRVSKSNKSIEPEPTSNQTKLIGRDTIVNLPSYGCYLYYPNSLY